MFLDSPLQPATTAASDAGAGLLAALLRMLADVTRTTPGPADAGRPFPVMGLDSLLGVEYVATVNARFGTDIKGAAVLDHPTPLAFARHVAAELRQAQPSPPAPLVPPPPSPLTPLADVLREELARVLECDPWDLGTGTPLARLGVDCLLGAEFMAAVNRIYGLRERAAVLHDHPSLTALAAHIALLLPGEPQAPAAPPHRAPTSLTGPLGAVCE